MRIQKQGQKEETWVGEGSVKESSWKALRYELGFSISADAGMW